MSTVRVGFVVDGLVPGLRRCFAGRTIRPLVTGWPSGTSGDVMRFGWMADYVNGQGMGELRYELYRSWRSYAVVVFLKSMGPDCYTLAARARRRGIRTVFDANVDYFTSAQGTFYYDGMAPTADQSRDAVAMAQVCDAVIGDSRYLADKAREHNARTVWIPDNVLDRDIAPGSSWRPAAGDKLPLIWCGQALKLFELLRIEEVLRRLRSHVRLRVVTNSLAALVRLHEPWQGRLHRLLADMDCEILPYRDVDHLLAVYDQGGVFISPRFLDNTYNLGHTEWKISLPMARGRVTLCSPQPSYVDLAERAAGRGVWVCAADQEWEAAIDRMLSGRFDWQGEQCAATEVVRRHYATSVVAEAHAGFMETLLQERGRAGDGGC